MEKERARGKDGRGVRKSERRKKKKEVEEKAEKQKKDGRELKGKD